MVVTVASSMAASPGLAGLEVNPTPDDLGAIALVQPVMSARSGP